jgi:hypothetical protein
LEWVGTPRLGYGDALAILHLQPPQQSALYRELHPQDYDRTRESQVLELLTVLVAQMQALVGNQSGVKPSQLPKAFDDLFAKQRPALDEATVLAEIAAMEARLRG